MDDIDKFLSRFNAEAPIKIMVDARLCDLIQNKLARNNFLANLSEKDQGNLISCLKDAFAELEVDIAILLDKILRQEA